MSHVKTRVITWSGTDSVLLNAVFLTKPVYDEAELGAKIKMTCDYAKKRNRICPPHKAQGESNKTL